MMGTDGLNWNPMQTETKSANKTLTGGAAQKNDSHYIELLAASAALDFLNADFNKLQQNKDNYKTEYLYRAVEDGDKFDFQDFVGKDRQIEFAKKLGCLVAFALFNNGEDDFVEKLVPVKTRKLSDLKKLIHHKLSILKITSVYSLLVGLKEVLLKKVGFVNYTVLLVEVTSSYSIRNYLLLRHGKN